MRRILALLMTGATLALTTSAGLAFGPAVHGSITQKFGGGVGDGDYLVAVDGTPHDVPLNVYLAVQVGDTLSFDGAHWTIAGREIE
jgi:hypothetical protein